MKKRMGRRRSRPLHPTSLQLPARPAPEAPSSGSPTFHLVGINVGPAYKSSMGYMGGHSADTPEQVHEVKDECERALRGDGT